MIKISLIYIGIVVAIAALITGVPMLVWTDETADKMEQVANLPISKLMTTGAAQGGSGLGSAEAGGAETSAPVAPLPSGVEAATAALLQGLSEPAAGSAAGSAAGAAAPPVATAEPAAPSAASSAAPGAAPPAPAVSGNLAAAVAAAVAVTAQPAPAPAAAANTPQPVGEDLTALIGATGAAQEELESMSGAALSGLRALRGAAAQGATLEELVARAAETGAQDDYIKALQEEARR